MNKSIFIFVITLGLVFQSCENTNSEPDEPTNLEYKQIGNVPYGDSSQQVYDIYLPKNRNSSTKVVILVHGGGWWEGDKVDMNGFKDFIQQNFPEMAVVNINYRLATNNNPHPMQINDITAIINQLKTKNDEYHIGEELSFIGVSAGGHLSLLYSYAYDTNKKVNWVCSIVGPTNLIDENYLNTQSQDLQTILARFGTDTEFLWSASPLYQAKSTSPPTAMFYGGVDPLVPNTQWQDMDAKLTELNVEHELTVYENEGHGWILLPLLDTSIKLKAFIEKYN